MDGNVQFLTDTNGKRTAVVIPIEDYEEYLIDIGMARAADEARDDPGRPLQDVIAELGLSDLVNV
jgi:hypothetical protein